MTDKEMKKLKDTLPKWRNGKAPVLTEEQKLLDKKLWCVEMINSILIYNGKENIMNNEYLKKYIEELGIEIVEELVNEQIKDFDKAVVLKDVVTDCEGLSYNSIIWADETISICVYRDTIKEHNCIDNLAEVVVTLSFFKQYFNEYQSMYFDDIDEFLNEYTADNTEDFYEYAMKNNAVIFVK